MANFSLPVSVLACDNVLSLLYFAKVPNVECSGMVRTLVLPRLYCPSIDCLCLCCAYNGSF